MNDDTRMLQVPDRRPGIGGGVRMLPDAGGYRAVFRLWPLVHRPEAFDDHGERLFDCDCEKQFEKQFGSARGKVRRQS